MLDPLPCPPQKSRRGRRLLRRTWPALLATCAGWQPGPARSAGGLDGETRARAALSITAPDLRDHIFLFADDTLEGREAGSRGGYTAGNYLAQKIRPHLEPAAGAGQYFQVFNGRYRNLLAVLPGSDPELKDEYILVGAHYDHVGYGTARNSNGPVGVIHNGADDNASGTSALLEAIQAFDAAAQRPRRSILFAFWDGEEKGLLGSEYWANHPTLPLAQIKLVINIDMLGRLGQKPLEVQGSRSMAGLRQLVAQANHASDLPLRFSWDVEPNSDHHTFYSRQIPFLMYHTGLHDDYHRPSDDAERVDLPGLQSAARLVFSSIVLAADADELSGYRVAAVHENETRRQQYEAALPQPVPRLGIAWEPFADDQHSGLRITSVAAGSASERAGLRLGDQLVGLDDLPLLSSSTLQQRAVTAHQLALEVLRAPASEPTTITVTLDQAPTRLGLSWRENAAEPGMVTVVRVVRHSVCDQADLRVGDRIWQLDGHEFRDSREFRELTETLQLPATVVLERQGRIMERILPSLPDELASVKQ